MKANTMRNLINSVALALCVILLFATAWLATESTHIALRLLGVATGMVLSMSISWLVLRWSGRL